MKDPDRLIAQTEMPFVKPTTKQMHALGFATWEEKFRPVVRDVVERLTVKECTVLFNASPSNISDAFENRDRKRPAMEWLVELLMHAPHTMRIEILAALCDLAGYMAPERKRTLSLEEKHERYRAAVAKRLAAAELAKIEQEIEES